MSSASKISKMNGHHKMTNGRLDTPPAPQLEFNVKQLLENYIASFEEVATSDQSTIDTMSTAHSTAKYEFEYFLSTLKQKQADEKLIVSVLGQLKPIIPLLEPARFENNLVNDLFVNIKWPLYYSDNQRVLDLLAELLVDLNAAYTNYIQKALNMIIRLFQTVPTSPLADKVVINCANVFKLAHEVLNHMIKTAPACKSVLVKQLEQLFPYMIKEASVQEAYMQNILLIAERFVDLRQKILEICVQKMLKIDVNCPREQILSSLERAETPPVTDLNNNTVEENNTKPADLSDRLDALMLCMFNYINRNCFNGTDLNWEMAKSIYKDLLFAFDKYVLLTYGPSHVQFLLFYMCSMRVSLAEGFLDYLWKKFNSIKSCSITKQKCAYYLGSLLARAKYISFITCTATLHLMIKWILSYIDKHHHSNSSAHHQFDMHRTFYALCQTVFYVIIFRNRQLFIDETASATVKTSSTNQSMIKSWKLNNIVTSKLNPLRYCLPSITKKFAKITYMHQVAYCYAVIDANNRITLPVTNGSHNTRSVIQSKGIVNAVAAPNPLDSFFPFDPYLLSKSKSFVESFYVEYKDVVDDDDEDSDETDDDDDDESEEESDDDTSSDSDDREDATISSKSRKRKMLDFDDSDLDNSVE